MTQARDVADGKFTNNIDISAGNLVLDNGYGIDFSATANSSGTVTHEILDDYEIGTFTPSFTSDGTNPTVSYSFQRVITQK